MSAPTTDKESQNETITEQTVKFHVEDGMTLENHVDRFDPDQTGQSLSIAAFLGRPVHVGNYSWLTSQATGADLFNLNLTSTIFGISAFTDKMKGFRYLKADIRVKLVIAPSPFHAGALRLTWLPWTASFQSNRGNMHKGLIPNSQLPGIMLTCEDNSVEMTIPYLGPLMGYDKAGETPNWGFGNLRLNVYSPLSTGSGSTTVAADLYIWLDNVKLAGVVAQSKFKAVARSKTRKTVVTDDEIGQGTGPISRVLSSSAVLANRLGDFPVLTPFFKPAAWLLNALRGSAESFGYSKPTTGESMDGTIMFRSMDAYAANSNGKDNAMSLSTLGDSKSTMNAMNQLTRYDESTIDYIKRQWSYFSSFTISTSDSPGIGLWTQNVTPLAFYRSYLVNSTIPGQLWRVYWHTPVSYLGAMFESYRGDIEIRLVFVKTGYHACQIEIQFQTELDESPPSEYLLREVVDIQKGNEFCFRVPYSKNKPFQSTLNPFGRVYVKLINSLQAPETVNSTIDVMIFVRGGENLTFSRPSSSVPIPVMGPQGAYKADSNSSICDKVEDIGNSTSSNAQTMLSQFVVGEHVSSLKQLCNKYTLMNFSSVTPAPRISFDPHFHGIARFVGSVTYTLDYSKVGLDYFSRFSALFLCHTGSMKIRFKCEPTLHKSLTTWLWPFTFNASADVGTFGALPLDAIYADYTMDTGLVSNAIRIPQYSKYLCYPHVNYINSEQQPWYNQSVVHMKYIDGADLNFNELLVYRSVGEDFQFQFFLGIPTTIINYAPI